MTYVHINPHNVLKRYEKPLSQRLNRWDEFGTEEPTVVTQLR